MARSRSKSRRSRSTSAPVKASPEPNIEQRDQLADVCFAELDSLIETVNQASGVPEPKEFNRSNQQTELELSGLQLEVVPKWELTEEQENDRVTLGGIETDRLFQRLEDRLELFLQEFDQRLSERLRDSLGDGVVTDRTNLQKKTDWETTGEIDPSVKACNMSADCRSELGSFDGSEVSSSNFNWERQKQQMFADLGISESNTTSADSTLDQVRTSGSQLVDSELVHEAGIVSAGDDSAPSGGSGFELFRNSIAKLDHIRSMDASDNQFDELEQLKEQLTTQLREAEIELSINRAKLSQEWAALEQREALLVQKESNLKSKYSPADQEGKTGLLDRFTRHLSQFNRK